MQPGTYRIEFFWWENGGGDHEETYIACGSFPNDADTIDWQPIGRVIPGGTFQAPGFTAAGVTQTSKGPLLVEYATSMGLADFDRVLNPNGAADDGLTNIAEIVVDKAAGTATLNWTSKPNKQYSVDQIEELDGDLGAPMPEEWVELEDGVPSAGDTTTHTIFIDTSLAHLFLRVRENG